MLKINEQIKFVIDAKGFKQGAIAKKAGYPEKMFSAMMTGKRKIYAEDIMPIAKALDVEPNELFMVSNEQEATELVPTG